MDDEQFPPPSWKEATIILTLVFEYGSHFSKVKCEQINLDC